MSRPPNRARGARLLLVGAIAGTAVYALATALLPLHNNDIWLHLTTGRLILDEGQVPTVDRYSFATAGTRYVAHEWLAASLYAAAERLGGTTAVILVGKVVPLALIGVFLALACRARGAPANLALPLVLLATAVLQRRLVARPELLAIPILLCTLFLLVRDRRDAAAGLRSGALWLLVPLQVLWANLHGSFLLGPLLVALFAASEAVERFVLAPGRPARALRALGVATGLLLALALTRVQPASVGLAAAALVAAFSALFALDARTPLLARRDPGVGQGPLRLAAVAAAMLAATLLNPLGLDLLLFPFEFTTGGSLVTTTINEWKPLLDADAASPSLQRALFLVYLAVCLAATGAAARRGRLDVLDAALLLLFAGLCIRHARWTALASLAYAPFLAAQLAAVRHTRPRPGWLPRGVALALAAPAVALSAWATWTLFAGHPDVVQRTAFGAAALCGGLALLLALRPSWPASSGSAGALAGSFALAGLAIGIGIPDVPGGLRKPWLGPPALRDRSPALQHRDALTWLVSQGFRGRLYTEYHWAPLVTHAAWPDVLTFIDSRSEVHGPDLLSQYLAAKYDGDAAARILADNEPDAVLIRFRPPPSVPANPALHATLEADPDWQLVYLDDGAALYRSARRMGDSPSAATRFATSSVAPTGPRVTDPVWAGDVETLLERAPRSAVLRTARAAHLAARGRSERALAELGTAWQHNPRWAGSAQLAGEILARQGRAEEARAAFERAQRVAPQWPAPRRGLAELEGAPTP